MEGIRIAAAILAWTASLLFLWVCVRHHMSIVCVPMSWTAVVAAFYTMRILFPEFGDPILLNTLSSATTIQGLFLCIGAVVVWRIKPWTHCR